MDNSPRFDRSLLIPLILGVFSVFGICLVLVLGQLNASRARLTVEETATPFHYIFIGTEPEIVSATPEDGEGGGTIETPEATSTVLSFFDENTPVPTRTVSSVVILSSSTPTTESSSTAPLNPGTYDDVDSHLLYNGDWVVQRGVTGVFENTLHISSTLENSVTFRFIGQQIRLFYQIGPGLGTILIKLDGVQFELDEAGTDTAIGEWSSPLLITGTHTVEISHASGGAINLDQVIVPDILLTSTPTEEP